MAQSKRRRIATAKAALLGQLATAQWLALSILKGKPYPVTHWDKMKLVDSLEA